MTFYEWANNKEEFNRAFTADTRSLAMALAYEAGQRNAVQPASAAIPADVARIVQAAIKIDQDYFYANGYGRELMIDEIYKAVRSLTRESFAAFEAAQAVKA